MLPSICVSHVCEHCLNYSVNVDINFTLVHLYWTQIDGNIYTSVTCHCVFRAIVSPQLRFSIVSPLPLPLCVPFAIVSPQPIPMCRRTTNVSPKPCHCVAQSTNVSPNLYQCVAHFTDQNIFFFYTLEPLPPVLISSIYNIFVLLWIEYGYYFWWKFPVLICYPFGIYLHIHWNIARYLLYSMWLFSFI